MYMEYNGTIKYKVKKEKLKKVADTFLSILQNSLSYASCGKLKGNRMYCEISIDNWYLEGELSNYKLSDEEMEILQDATIIMKTTSVDTDEFNEINFETIIVTLDKEEQTFNTTVYNHKDSEFCSASALKKYDFPGASYQLIDDCIEDIEYSVDNLLEMMRNEKYASLLPEVEYLLNKCERLS